MGLESSGDVSGSLRRSRVPFEYTLAWRILSFILGVAGPVWIWTWIAQLEFGTPPESAEPSSLAHHLLWRGSTVFVALEVAGMTRWLLRRPVSAAASRAFAFLFGLGVVFAAGWSLFALWGLIALLGEPERDMLWHSPIALVFASPVVCMFVYAIHARVAWIGRTRVGAS